MQPCLFCVPFAPALEGCPFVIAWLVCADPPQWGITVMVWASALLLMQGGVLRPCRGVNRKL